LDDTELLARAYDLFFLEANEIIDQDGFLREGSSHYHLIATKWFCELEYILQKAGYSGEADRLHTYTKRTCARVVFFLLTDKNNPEKAALPLFGDVSPDFDPQWMKRYFRVLCKDQSASDIPGNHYADDLLRTIGLTSLTTIDNDPVKSESYECYTRLSCGKMTLFIKHNKIKKNFFPGHAHDDLFHYVFFHEGKEIIGDPGRLNYMTSSFTNPYCKSFSHNVLSINDLPVEAPDSFNYYLPEYYKGGTVEKKVVVTETGICFTISTDTVSRITSAKLNKYIRRFFLSEGCLHIVDEIDGKGDMKIQGQLNFPPGVIVSTGDTADSFKINHDMVLTMSKTPVGFEQKQTKFSLKYGEEQVASGLSFTYHSRDSFANKMELRII